MLNGKGLPNYLKDLTTPVKSKLDTATLSSLKQVSVRLTKLTLNLENGTIALKQKPIYPRSGILGRPKKYKNGHKKDKAQKRALEKQPEPELDFNRGESLLNSLKEESYTFVFHSIP